MASFHELLPELTALFLDQLQNRQERLQPCRSHRVLLPGYRRRCPHKTLLYTAVSLTDLFTFAPVGLPFSLYAFSIT